MRSCRPFSCGQPFLIRSRIIPNWINQTDNRLKPPIHFPANSVPLSLRIAPGSPYSLKIDSRCSSVRLLLRAEEAPCILRTHTRLKVVADELTRIACAVIFHIELTLCNLCSRYHSAFCNHQKARYMAAHANVSSTLQQGLLFWANMI